MKQHADSPTSKATHERHVAHTAAAPIFRALTNTECEKILSRNHVARLAFSFHDRVDIEPVHYVYENGWMFGRTSPGSKLTTLAHSHWMAAEVDEIAGIFEWRSVVVRGSFYTVSPEVPGAEATAWARGVELLRTLIPETATPEDPVPFRTIIFQIHAEEMVGREAMPGNR